MYAALLDEGALVQVNQGAQSRGQPRGQYLCSQFGEEMDQANRPVVPQGFRVTPLRQQYNQGLIKALEPAPIHGMQLGEGKHKIILDRSPAAL
jgi:hypothetical protein